MELYVRSDSLVSRVIAGETLIVPVRKGVADLASIYSLNEVGTSIWQAISSPRSTEEIVQLIAGEFAADPQDIKRDVESFLAEMQSAGLVADVGVAVSA